jgi:hypothetical protein
MLTNPIRTAAARRAILTIVLAGVLASAAPAFACQAPAQARVLPEQAGTVLAYPGGGLPGEGRPPSPGPTDPDGRSY